MSTLAPPSSADDSIVQLAARHGLNLRGDVVVEDIGLDFRVAFATAADGQRWVLRIPRRADVIEKARHESQILRTIRPHLSVAIPDWRIHSSELIAYPLLAGTPAIKVDPVLMEPIWHLDREAPEFAESLGEFLSALHGLEHQTIVAAGLPLRNIDEVRSARAAAIERVQHELGIADQLLQRWRKWLDDDRSWPPHSAMTHGDLYVAHTLIDEGSRVVGVLDWTEAAMNDPAVDFTAHLLAFGEPGLDQLIAAYERHGGRTWPTMRHHITERLAMSALDYALFALSTQDAEHLRMARTKLSADST